MSSDPQPKHTEIETIGLQQTGDEKHQDEVIEPVNVEAQSLEVGSVDDLSKPATAFDVLTHSIHLSDDPSQPAITFRSVFIGCGLSVFGGVLSGIYYFKPQTVTISPVFLAILAFLLGEAMAFTLPRAGKVGRFLNPHAFNIKEHLMITIMANSASISALGIQVIAVERLYYAKELNAALSIFMLLSAQAVGYGMAGLMRRTLVYPKSMLWPAAIPVNAMLENLHKRSPEGRKPLRVFYYVAIGIFFWEMFPQWIMPILTGISVFCLANQSSPTFTNIFGGAEGNEGLGLFSICLDWLQISADTSPLYMPLSTLISQGLGICACVIVFASMYYANVYDAKSYPFLSQLIFSSNSTSNSFIQYNQTAAIGADGKVDMSSVETLGLPQFSMTNVLNLLMTNMATTAAITHLLLWYPTEMKMAFSFLDPRRLLSALRNFSLRPTSRLRSEPDEMRDHYDPHYALITKYKTCPDWWYAVLLVLSMAVGLIIIYQSDSTLPWWGFFVACILGWLLLLVIGSIQGITGVKFTIQSICQMVAGYMRPGYPIANMYFSLFGYNVLLQGRLLANDLKLAQYGHLAPRVTFFAQMLGTIIGTVLNYVMANSIITNQADILKSIEGTNIWSGNQAQQFNAQSVTFGGFPHELFDIGAKYQWVPLASLLGFVVPIPFWLAHRQWPKLGLDQINTPVIIFFIIYLNVGINSSLMTYFIFGFAAQWWIRRKYPNIFVRYNYLVSAALDGGTSIMVFILSFAVLGAAGAAVAFPKYWGNNSDGHIDYCWKAPGA